MFHIQQQVYVTLILHNVTMHTCRTCIIHGDDLITNVKDTNWALWTTTLIVFLPQGSCHAIS
jgi:hypothetical protein